MKKMTRRELIVTKEKKNAILLLCSLPVYMSSDKWYMVGKHSYTCR